MWAIIWGMACGNSQPEIVREVQFCEQEEETLSFPPETDLTALVSGYRVRMSFFGDLFWGRGVNRRAQRTEDPFMFPFAYLDSFGKYPNETWVANLECPITKQQSTYEQQKKLLKFSCRPEYLPNARKFFDVFSLANNHTYNMNEVNGLQQTRDYLNTYGFQFFGHYNNVYTEDLCEVVHIPAEAMDETGNPHRSGEVRDIPVVFCGYHNVIRLPTDKQIEVINQYAKHFITFVMPHQGVEYDSKSNSWQKKIFSRMIDQGADIVVGGHTHSIQDIGKYKDKVIVYSLGNAIFDQQFGSTMYGLVVRLQMFLDHKEPLLQYETLFDLGDCSLFKDWCLINAQQMQLKKPSYTASYGVDILHNKKMQPRLADEKLEKRKRKELRYPSFIQNSWGE